MGHSLLKLKGKTTVYATGIDMSRAFARIIAENVMKEDEVRILRVRLCKTIRRQDQGRVCSGYIDLLKQSLLNQKIDLRSRQH